MGQARKRHEAGTFHAHVKRGDQVLILAGRSVNEIGRVVSVEPQRERAIVEGHNLVTKHQASKGPGRNPAAQQQQSGRIEKAAPIHVSNLMVVCPNCNKPTRVARAAGADRTIRVCKRCSSSLERSVED